MWNNAEWVGGKKKAAEEKDEDSPQSNKNMALSLKTKNEGS